MDAILDVCSIKLQKLQMQANQNLPRRDGGPKMIRAKTVTDVTKQQYVSSAPPCFMHIQRLVRSI